MRYPVMIRRTGTGYSADVPDLPGCVATGKTVEKTRGTIAEAIRMHLELMAESGEPIPAASSQIQLDVDEDSDEEFCTWVEVDEPTAVGR